MQFLLLLLWQINMYLLDSNSDYSPFYLVYFKMKETKVRSGLIINNEEI